MMGFVENYGYSRRICISGIYRIIVQFELETKHELRLIRLSRKSAMFVEVTEMEINARDLHIKF